MVIRPVIAVRRSQVIVILVVLATAVSGAVDFRGRYENQLSVMSYRSGMMFFNENAVLAGFQGRSGTLMSFEASAWARTVHGADVFDLTMLLPGEITDTLPDSLRAMLEVPFARGFTLDRAYATFNPGPLRLRVGKQPLAWGVGYLWNPTEVVPPKSWLDPSYEREGMNALRVELLRPVRLQAVGLVGPDLAGSGFIGRVAGNLAGFDWGVTGWRRPEESRPIDYFIGGQFQGELVFPGLWGEGGYHFASEGRPAWWELVVGTDYTLPSRTWLMAEYRRNSAGVSGADGYRVEDWLSYLSAGQDGLGRDYLYAAARQPFAGFNALSFGILANLGDRSVVCLPGVHLGLADNVDLNAFGIWSLGQGGSEYGAGRARGAVARLTLYF